MMILAGIFAAKLLGNILQSKAQNKQIKAQNKAIYAQNQRALIQASQEASQAYAQAGSAASQATGLSNEAGRLTQIEQGNQATASAAAGTIGSSVNAVQLDLERQEQVRKATIAEDLDMQLQNARSRANSAYSSAINNFGTGQKMQSTGSMWTSGIINAGIGTAASYLGQTST